jgi:hypothetical protein
MSSRNLGQSLYRYTIPNGESCRGMVNVDGFCRTQGVPVATNAYGPGIAIGDPRRTSVAGSEVVLFNHVRYARFIAVKASDARAARTAKAPL